MLDFIKKSFRELVEVMCLVVLIGFATGGAIAGYCIADYYIIGVNEGLPAGGGCFLGLIIGLERKHKAQGGKEK